MSEVISLWFCVRVCSLLGEVVCGGSGFYLFVCAFIHYIANLCESTGAITHATNQPAQNPHVGPRWKAPVSL